jgi:predicted NBD/HSP70 family sugar kinase
LTFTWKVAEAAVVTELVKSGEPLGAERSTRGSDQSGVRLYNERLVLTLIRRHRSLPKAAMARMTGLSAQTVSVIVRQLEADGLLIKEKPQRGKVGQPLVPFSLNPEGAFFIGLKIGRRSSDLMLIDFLGRVRENRHETFLYPEPQNILESVRESLKQLTGGLARSERKRINGLGIAAPFELWNWAAEIGAPQTAMDAWRGFDFRAAVKRFCSWPVYYSNDATAACAAELVFGKGNNYRDYAYFFIGTFVGGGVVLGGHIFEGRTGFAGAFGTLPVPGLEGTDQLIRRASLYLLERRLAESGRNPALLAATPNDWGNIGEELELWIADTAAALAHAVIAAMSVIDFEAVIIDGAMPEAVRADLVEALRIKLADHDLRGLPPFELTEGTLGSGARAMGGACQSLIANFAVDREILFKDMP